MSCTLRPVEYTCVPPSTETRRMKGRSPVSAKASGGTFFKPSWAEGAISSKPRGVRCTRRDTCPFSTSGEAARNSPTLPEMILDSISTATGRAPVAASNWGGRMGMNRSSTSPVWVERACEKRICPVSSTVRMATCWSSPSGTGVASVEM